MREIPLGQGITRLLTTKDLREIEAAVLQVEGSESTKDKEAGVWKMSIGDQVVVSALQKGSGGPWITRLSKEHFTS